MMNVILREGLEDREFMERRTIGFEELQNSGGVRRRGHLRSLEWQQRL